VVVRGNGAGLGALAGDRAGLGALREGPSWAGGPGGGPGRAGVSWTLRRGQGRAGGPEGGTGARLGSPRRWLPAAWLRAAGSGRGPWGSVLPPGPHAGLSLSGGAELSPPLSLQVFASRGTARWPGGEDRARGAGGGPGAGTPSWQGSPEGAGPGRGEAGGLLSSGWVWPERSLSGFMGPLCSLRGEHWRALRRGAAGRAGGCAALSPGGATASLCRRPGAVTSARSRLLHQTPAADHADR